jgi:hypothetical protein
MTTIKCEVSDCKYNDWDWHFRDRCRLEEILITKNNERKSPRCAECEVKWKEWVDDEVKWKEKEAQL